GVGAQREMWADLKGAHASRRGAERGPSRTGPLPNVGDEHVVAIRAKRYVGQSRCRVHSDLCEAIDCTEGRRDRTADRRPGAVIPDLHERACGVEVVEGYDGRIG